DGLEEMALRILRSEASRNLHCLSASEFGDFKRNAVKFSQFHHSLDFLVLLCQDKRTKKNLV
ncbi:MAG: hypothetical protein KY428_05025, partial [Bacteroidetes bacterium]|nr:hypothetical protein [Bacteroidota bacterium]